MLPVQKSYISNVQDGRESKVNDAYGREYGREDVRNSKRLHVLKKFDNFQKLSVLAQVHDMVCLVSCLILLLLKRLKHRCRNRGALGARDPQDFAINEEVPFLFLESAPVFLRKKCPRSVVPLQV